MMIMVDCAAIFIVSSLICTAAGARVRRGSRLAIATTKHFHSHHALAIYHIRERRAYIRRLFIYEFIAFNIVNLQNSITRLLKNSYTLYSFFCARAVVAVWHIYHSLDGSFERTLAEF